MAGPQPIAPEILDWRRRRAAKLVLSVERLNGRSSARRIKVGNREVLVLKRSRQQPVTAS